MFVNTSGSQYPDGERYDTYVGFPYGFRCSVRDDRGVQAVRDHVSVGQAVVLDGPRGQALERGVPERVDDGREALLGGLEDLLGRLTFVVHRVDVGAVR